MGFTIHHTITVTSGSADRLTEARAKAVSLGAQVTEIVESAVNGVGSFLIAPDGSKEGWAESDQGDERRAQFKAWLRGQSYSDWSTPFKWFEVAHPEDGAPRVVDHQDRRTPI